MNLVFDETQADFAELLVELRKPEILEILEADDSTIHYSINLQ